MLKPLVPVLILSLLFSVAVLNRAQANDPIRIMPLGDSITQSNTNYNSYRRPLWFKLQDGGYNVDFVGSDTLHYGADNQPNGLPPDPDFDTDHEGHWGWRADEILNGLDEMTPQEQAVNNLSVWAADAVPDIVLMHLGTNDIFQGDTPEQATADLGAIIDVLRGVNPNVVVFVAQVIPHNRGDRPSLDPYNAALPAFVAAKTTSQSPVILVDHNTGFSAFNDTFDAVHPNAQGEEKIAQNWYDAVSNYLDTAPPPVEATSTPSPTPTPTFTPTPTSTPPPANSYRESELQAELDAEIAATDGEITFALIDFEPGQITFTVRLRDGTLGLVPVLFTDEGGVVSIQFGAMTVNGSPAPAAFSDIVRTELVPLMVNALTDLLVAELGSATGVEAITFTDNRMNVTVE